MRRRRLLPILAALLPLAAACRREASGPLRIGVVMDGDGVVGARLALADARAEGPIDGRPLELVVHAPRQATVAEPAIAAADSLADDPRVAAVVGHSNSAASLAASQVYNARRLPQLAPTTTAPVFAEAGPYSFRLVPDDGRQAEFLARQVAGEGARRVALVYVSDDYGRALAAAVRERLAAGDARTVYESPYLEGADSARLAASALAAAAARPDLVLWLGRARELSQFLVPMRARLPRVPVYASDGVGVGFAYAAPQRFDGVRFVRFVDPAGGGEPLRRFRERYRAEEKRELTTDAVLAYDATMLIVAAMRAGARDREGVRAYLERVGHGGATFVGLSGPVAFDARGDVTRPHLLAEARADDLAGAPAR
ncbi:ABC transporter substrate-binding protein [Roseisolibacter sp. H3M3-2]|uniref:ABC transporter substrate-binding protein n=1 Tax=Roseisolibacter sp. H3M3-2 TaxID=3031323 RepID=UPI0023DCE9FD|nr:ABC transporter substrate-binding protein [Roseisolibacter sp. H3M3-2]MDF1504810.1 ABC transporter substrate-binding protein [Roseisolibacter sp. H3M3-2]